MRYIRYALYILLITLIVGLRSVVVFALDIPPRPNESSVVDQTNTLTAGQKTDLSVIIENERTTSGNQIAILMISSLQGDSLEDYSIRVARNWGVGDRDKNNGVLLVIAKDDRKMRIEVGYGLEGALTDVRSGQIIRNDIAPKFKENNYYEGVKSGLQSIIASIHNEYQASDVSNKSQSSISELLTALIFFGPVWFVSVLARSKSWWAGGIFGFFVGMVLWTRVNNPSVGGLVIIFTTLIGLLLDWLVSRNYKERTSVGRNPSWWAGGAGLGGGRSGGGFGGGGFGGGGSSGSW